MVALFSPSQYTVQQMLFIKNVEHWYDTTRNTHYKTYTVEQLLLLKNKNVKGTFVSCEILVYGFMFEVSGSKKQEKGFKV